jgi:hypothetical protein
VVWQGRVNANAILKSVACNSCTEPVWGGRVEMWWERKEGLQVGDNWQANFTCWASVNAHAAHMSPPCPNAS